MFRGRAVVLTLLAACLAIAGAMPAVAVPLAPSNLTATAVSGTEIDLTWQDNSSDETSFSIQRSLSPTSGFTAIKSAKGNVTSFQNVSLTGATRYYYRVKAVRRNVGSSDFS